MRFSSLMRRRPSASLVVSFIALFVALGGVGYAAIHLPPNSVGSAQLKNGSVGNAKLKSGSVGPRKIIPGAVGARQVNSTQVQLRVGSACSTGAVKAIELSGTVRCTPTLPNEVGTRASAVRLGTSATRAASQSLPAGSSYLVLAFAHVDITPGGPLAAPQRVAVDCTLSVPSGSGPDTTTKGLAVDLGTDGHAQGGSIPLVLPVGSAAAGRSATVSCTDTPTPSTPDPAVAVATTVNAIQTAANG